MTKKYILLQIKELHDLSNKCSYYEKLINDEILDEDKKNIVKQWLKNELQNIEDIKKTNKEPLRKMFYDDVHDKYLINVSSHSSLYNYVMLIHITDVYIKHKSSSYFKHDLSCGVNGEFSFSKFTKSGKLVETAYYEEIGEFDEVGPYLTTNHFYNFIPEGVNGWKEISKEQYELMISPYRLNIKYDFKDLENMGNTIYLKVPEDKMYLK